MEEVLNVKIRMQTMNKYGVKVNIRSLLTIRYYEKIK